MKIVIIGATGLVGGHIVSALENEHEVIRVGYKDGDYSVDIADINSIKKMYQKIGNFDALVSATGLVEFGPLRELSQEQWKLGFDNKLLGQINLVLEGLKHINDNGSFTLTSGIISQDPIRFGAAATTVNRGIEGFVASAALEMTNGIRINVVSPTLLEEAVENFGPYFKGFDPVPGRTVALGFVKSVEGLKNGETIEVRGVV